MSFNMNTARSFLGRNVNLHLKDGSVIINVHVANVQRGDFRRENFLTYTPYGNGHIVRVALERIAWAEPVDLNMIMMSA